MALTGVAFSDDGSVRYRLRMRVAIVVVDVSSSAHGSPSRHLQGSTSFVNLPNLQHLRAAFWAPRADNRMNASSAQAEYIQGAPERIRFTLVLLVSRVILDY